MTASHHQAETRGDDAPFVSRTCPPWCVAAHGVQDGEEDWIHSSEPVMVTGMSARACMSIDPDTGAVDGPYVLLGESELTMDETRALGASLIELAGLVPVPGRDLG